MGGQRMDWKDTRWERDMLSRFDVRYPFGRPKGIRSDVRIREDVCECLAYAEDLDVSEIEVAVCDGAVTLLGSVPARRQKVRAAELSVDVTGVTEIHNRLRVRSQS